jgi:hypothetical protein
MFVTGFLYVSLRRNGSRWIYRAEVNAAVIWLRYTLLLLIFPAYFIALSRRWWTTIPLWLVSASVMLTQFLMSAGQSDPIGGGTNQLGFVYVGEMTKIMLIPIAVQFAIVLRGMGIGAGRRANHGSRKLVEAFDAGER